MPNMNYPNQRRYNRSRNNKKKSRKNRNRNNNNNNNNNNQNNHNSNNNHNNHSSNNKRNNNNNNNHHNKRMNNNKGHNNHNHKNRHRRSQRDRERNCNGFHSHPQSMNGNNYNSPSRRKQCLTSSSSSSSSQRDKWWRDKQQNNQSRSDRDTHIKRRPSYTELSPEAPDREIEDNNADFIGGSESVESADVIISDYGHGLENGSDSNINTQSDKENVYESSPGLNQVSNTSDSHNPVYMNINQRTQRKYRFRRKSVNKENQDNNNNNKEKQNNQHKETEEATTSISSISATSTALSSGSSSGPNASPLSADSAPFELFEDAKKNGNGNKNQNQHKKSKQDKVEMIKIKSQDVRSGNMLKSNGNNTFNPYSKPNVNGIGNRNRNRNGKNRNNNSYNKPKNMNMNMNMNENMANKVNISVPPLNLFSSLQNGANIGHPHHSHSHSQLFYEPQLQHHVNNMIDSTQLEASWRYRNMHNTNMYSYNDMNMNMNMNINININNYYNNNMNGGLPPPQSYMNVHANKLSFLPQHGHMNGMNGMNGMNNSISSSPPMQIGCDELQQLKQRTDGECFLCIDVECAAIGYGHFDSAPCRIALVDFYGTVLLDRICQVPHIMDSLKEFTGLTKADISLRGYPLKQVLGELHSILTQYQEEYKFGVTIIGQNVVMDLIWTGLQKGVHYQRTIDTAHLFKTQTAKWSKYQYYSLRQLSFCLLEQRMNVNFHDPTEDAQVTIELYRNHCLETEKLEIAKKKLMEYKAGNKFPDFRVKCKFPQCSGMYSPRRCSCEQPTAADINGCQDIEKLRALYQRYSTKPVTYYKPKPKQTRSFS